MKEENATSKNPIYKVIKKINNASDLDRLYKTGEYGITSLEAVNGSFNFGLDILPVSATGLVMQRQTPSDSVGLVTYVRFLIAVNVWEEWVSYDTQGPVGEKGDKGEIGGQGPGGTNGTNGTNGVDGTAGIDGVDGKSAYQSYVDTTTDNPVMTEGEWSNQIGDIESSLDAILLILASI